MRVDDAGQRAGAELRDRFADEYAPALPWELVAAPARRTYMNRFVLVLAGLMVVAVATSLTLVALDARTPTRSGRSGPMWQRVSFDRAFGRNAEVSHVVSGGERWVTTGSIQHPERGCIRWGCDTPAVWTSPDGTRWTRARGPRIGRIAAVAASGRTFTLIEQSRRGDRVWTSEDGRTWTPRHRFPIDSAEWNLFTADRQFVAASFQIRGPPNTTVWRSADGRRWRRVRQGVGTNFGLVTQAQLHGRYLTVGLEEAGSGGPFGDRSPISVMASRNGVDWSPVRSNLVPEFVRSNSAHSVLLGVRSDPRGTPGAAHLFMSSDGSRWREVHGFRERFPYGNPDEIIASGRWWVVAGSQGYDPRASRIWVSPDRRHWIRLPRSLWLPPTNTNEFIATSRNKTILVMSPTDRSFWLWHRPRKVPRLVAVNGGTSGSGGPCCKKPVINGEVEFARRDRPSVSVDVVGQGEFTVDLEPGTYRMTGTCGTQTVRVPRNVPRVDVLCGRS